MRRVAEAGLAVVGLVNLSLLNLVAFPRYVDERARAAIVRAAASPEPGAEASPREAPRAPLPPVAAPAALQEPSAPPPDPAPRPAEAPPDRGASPPPRRVEPAYFTPGSYELRPFVQVHLREVVVMMRRRPGLRVRLRGHADDQGLADLNQELSERRAEAVAAYLVEQGVARDRIEVDGVGERMPADSRDTPAARAVNRRVEVLWTAGAGEGR